MQIQTRMSGAVTILDAQGEITFGECTTLRLAVSEALDGTRNLLLNLSGVTVIDSDGVAELLTCNTIVKDRGGSLRLLNLPQNLDMRDMSYLISVFEIYGDEAEAIHSF